MRLPFAVTLVCLLFASGCVSQQRYRYLWNQPQCFGTTVDPIPGQPNERRDWASLDCRTALYTVGFIELDEHGRALDADQGVKVRRLIEQRKKSVDGGKVITVVYVHGWKNNASQARPGDKAKDVEKFQTALTDLGLRSREIDPRAPARVAPTVPVIGVYIAWRGKSLMGPDWFTFLSYWGRRNTGNHVGAGPDLAPILNDIIDTTNAGDTGSRVLLIGHSFGARVLEHAVATRKVLLQAPAAEGSSATLTPRVDLLLYVNSANDARLSLRTVLDLKASPITVRHPDYDAVECKDGTRPAAQCSPYPLAVAITSVGDLATKYLLPTANRLNYDGSAAEVPTVPPGPYLDEVPSPGRYKRAAAAHMPFMQSHDVRPVACPTRQRIEEEIAASHAVWKEQNPGADDNALERRRAIENNMRLRRAPKCSPGDPTCRFAFRTVGETAACYEAHERRGPRPLFNNTAFWIMTVDKDVIDDHGDIWNRTFVAMLGELMAPAGFFTPGARRMLVRTQ
jgi:hypothetical protein